MSETIAGQCTPHRRWMLRSKLLPVYFPNTIAKVSNSTVKSKWLCLCVPVRVCACVFCGRRHFFFAEGGGGGGVLRVSVCGGVCFFVLVVVLGVCVGVWCVLVGVGGGWGGGGGFNMSRPRGPWFLNSSMCV